MNIVPNLWKKSNFTEFQRDFNSLKNHFDKVKHVHLQNCYSIDSDEDEDEDDWFCRLFFLISSTLIFHFWNN